MQDDKFELGGRAFKSRLIVGTGKYRDFEETRAAVEASGAEIVTVAVRRVNITDRKRENLLDFLDPERFLILPNTAGCYTAEEAIRTCRLARETGVGEFVKLEVIGDQQTLFPDVPRDYRGRPGAGQGRLQGDALHHRRSGHLPAAGGNRLRGGDAAGGADRQRAGNPQSLQPAHHPGTGKVPVVVDAGVGTASDAALAMELGCDAVLMNTAIAGARDPIAMAHAMRMAVEAGRIAYLAGRIERKLYATASSPLSGLIE